MNPEWSVEYGRLAKCGALIEGRCRHCGGAMKPDDGLNVFQCLECVDCGLKVWPTLDPSIGWFQKPTKVKGGEWENMP